MTLQSRGLGDMNRIHINVYLNDIALCICMLCCVFLLCRKNKIKSAPFILSVNTFSSCLGKWRVVCIVFYLGNKIQTQTLIRAVLVKTEMFGTPVHSDQLAGGVFCAEWCHLVPVIRDGITEKSKHVVHSEPRLLWSPGATVRSC